MDHLNDNYDKFWYYLDEKSVPPTKQGPYTRQEIVDLKFAKIIDDFSLVWHPLIGGWKVAAHVRLLGKNRKEPPAEVFNCLETLKQESSLQPVSLKQGYLHMQKKKHKELWKARWIVMTESSVIFYTIPNGKIKAEIKAAEAIITPKILQNKANALGFVIEIPQQSSNYLFWSPFQKEVLEWITELRKLKYLLGLGEISAKYILPCQCAYNETNLIVPIGLAKQKQESPYYKKVDVMRGYVFFRDYLKASKIRHRRWAVMKAGNELKLYKTYREGCETEGKCRKIRMNEIEVEVHKERDDEYGFYMRIKVGTEAKYEIWTDTLKEYELWVDFLKGVKQPYYFLYIFSNQL
eukprot:TRINITY_DN177_c0_g1_i1.p4 TRINITY_DN177_c0_g1~~TRINITY_DN177_c0_g1_i1.p4  ORF type:complete len:350 (-),score=37.15 TRINITY_DN177_c0_g1_i1:2377-3426(-)